MGGFALLGFLHSEERGLVVTVVCNTPRARCHEPGRTISASDDMMT